MRSEGPRRRHGLDNSTHNYVAEIRRDRGETRPFLANGHPTGAWTMTAGSRIRSGRKPVVSMSTTNGQLGRPAGRRRRHSEVDDPSSRAPRPDSGERVFRRRFAPPLRPQSGLARRAHATSLMPAPYSNPPTRLMVVRMSGPVSPAWRLAGQHPRLTRWRVCAEVVLDAVGLRRVARAVDRIQPLTGTPHPDPPKARAPHLRR